jgi:hypothetical protein
MNTYDLGMLKCNFNQNNTMTTDIHKVVDHAYRLVYITRNVAHHRSLNSFRDDFNQTYWILISNNFLDVAILEWCKVFGSTSDATHWTSNVLDRAAFRTGLLEKLKVTKDEWIAYRERVKTYRDKVIAHYDNNSTVIDHPDFCLALKACFYYYDMLISQLKRGSISTSYPESLDDYYEESLAQAKVFSETAYKATKSLDDSDC